MNTCIECSFCRKIKSFPETDRFRAGWATLIFDGFKILCPACLKRLLSGEKIGEAGLY